MCFSFKKFLLCRFLALTVQFYPNYHQESKNTLRTEGYSFSRLLTEGSSFALSSFLRKLCLHLLTNVLTKLKMLCSLFYNFLYGNLLPFKSFLNACTEGDNESLTLIFRKN